jgi:hypothetical protein
MSQVKHLPANRAGAQGLSIEQLEAGLRVMANDGFSSHDFWDEHVASFRQTVLFAIRETSDALLSPTIPLHWRIELESQLESLVQYIELADRYIAHRSLSPKPSLSVCRSGSERIH